MAQFHPNLIDCARRRAMLDGAVHYEHQGYQEARKRYWRQQEAIAIMLGEPSWEGAKQLGF